MDYNRQYYGYQYTKGSGMDVGCRWDMRDPCFHGTMERQYVELCGHADRDAPGSIAAGNGICHKAGRIRGRSGNIDSWDGAGQRQELAAVLRKLVPYGNLLYITFGSAKGKIQDKDSVFAVSGSGVAAGNMYMICFPRAYKAVMEEDRGKRMIKKG